MGKNSWIWLRYYGAYRRVKFFNFSVVKLSQRKICDIIISMICINRETTKLDMYRLFQYSKVAGCSEIVNAKFISKIGHFPDIREWEANKSYTI